MIGDVAGHGPDEAALGVALRIALACAHVRRSARPRPDARARADPAHRARGQGHLRDGVEPRDSARGVPDSARFARAIPECCCTGSGTVEWLEPPGGPALGLSSGDWDYHQVEWPAGTGLVLLTDGLFEGHSGRGNERLGEEGLLELARSHARPARSGVRRRAHRRSRAARRGTRRAHRRHRGGPRGAHRPMTTPRKPKPGRRLTVQGWQNLVLSAMGVVVLVGLVAGGVADEPHRQLSRELIDNIQPARVAAYAAAGGASRPGNRRARLRHHRRQAVPRPVLRRAGRAKSKRRERFGERVGGRPELMTDLD